MIHVQIFIFLLHTPNDYFFGTIDCDYRNKFCTLLNLKSIKGGQFEDNAQCSRNMAPTCKMILTCIREPNSLNGVKGAGQPLNLPSILLFNGHCQERQPS